MVMEVVLIVPTYNPGEQWLDWLDAVSSQDISLSAVYVIDSGSTDSTVERAEKYGYECHVIDKADFSHGGTRQLAAEKFPNADVLIYLTQDAILACNNSLRKLINEFESSNVGVAYGRQLPRKKANLIEGHARLFNYPDISHIRTFNMKGEFGVKTAFASNSFSAYRVSALRQIGGFPLHTIVSEDMYVAANMLKAGWAVAYCAESRVYHSHSYTLAQEFRRYFDIGVFNNRESWIMKEFGGAESEGVKFIKSEIFYLLNNNPFLIFESVIRTVVKYAGYMFGKNENRLPVSIKKIMSNQPDYWESY